MIAPLPLPLTLPLPVAAPDPSAPANVEAGPVLSFSALLADRAGTLAGGALAPATSDDPERLAKLEAAPLAVPFLQAGVFGSAVAAFAAPASSPASSPQIEGTAPAWQSDATMAQASPPLAGPPIGSRSSLSDGSPSVAQQPRLEATADGIVKFSVGTREAEDGGRRAQIVEQPCSRADRRAEFIPAAEAAEFDIAMEPDSATERWNGPRLATIADQAAFEPAIQRYDFTASPRSASPVDAPRAGIVAKQPAVSSVPSAPPARQSSGRSAAGTARSVFETASQPISVTLHADGPGVQVVARLGGLNGAEFLRLGSQLLAESDLAVSSLILDGRRLGRPARK